MSNNCQQCLYWERHTREDREKLPHGYCRRNAPKASTRPPIQISRPMSMVDLNIYTQWATTFEDDWCGDFRMDMGKRILDEMEKSEGLT